MTIKRECRLCSYAGTLYNCILITINSAFEVSDLSFIILTVNINCSKTNVATNIVSDYHRGYIFLSKTVKEALTIMMIEAALLIQAVSSPKSIPN